MTGEPQVQLTPQQALARMEEPRRCVSPEGRAILAAAVQIDHDWSLRFSGEDKLIDTIAGMSAEDLEAADLLVQYLQSAIAVGLIERDMGRNGDTPDGGA